MIIKKQDIVKVFNNLIINQNNKIISKGYEHFDSNNDGYIDLFDFMNSISTYSQLEHLSTLQENKLKNLISEKILKKSNITLREFNKKINVTFNDEIINSIGGRVLGQKDIKALRMEQKENLNIDWRNVVNNPIVKVGLKTHTYKFVTVGGEPYIKGNILHDKYNGEYHIHKLGDICAGSHDDMMYIKTERSLYIDELYDKNEIDKQIQNMFVNSLEKNNYASSDILPDQDLPFNGMTSTDYKHNHQFTIHRNRTVTIHPAIHPKERRIKHRHSYVGIWPNGRITENKSDCFPHCQERYGISGAGPHIHNIELTKQINNVNKNIDIGNY